MKRTIFFVLLITIFSIPVFATTYTISTSGFSYSPSTVNAHVGDTITINASTFHPTAQVDQATWNANGTTPMTGGWGVLTSTYTFTAQTVETIYYVCQNHVAAFGMKGSIVVSAAANSILVTNPTAGAVFCQGSSANITWTATNVANVMIQLSSDGGATFPATITSSTPAASGSYSWNIPQSQAAGSNYAVKVTDVSNSSVSGTSGVFIISGSPAITMQPQSATACTGGVAVLSVSASGGGLTYQWRKNNTNISGATKATYMINNVAMSDAGNYDCIISGTCGAPVTSSQAVLTVNQSALITSQPASQEVCAGSGVTFSVTASATGINYQWFKDGAAIANASQSSYTIASVTVADAGKYYVIVNGTCNNPATSSNAILTVDQAPIITKNPAPANPCLGDTAIFTVTATGSGLFYQWQKDGLDIAGANSASLVISNVNMADIGLYTVTVSGKCQPPVNSQGAMLIINSKPMITSQPASQTVTAGGSTDFTVIAVGLDLSYQWMKNGIIIQGATTNDYHIANAALADSGSYSCNVTNKCGTVLSQAAVLKVSPSNQGPVLTISHSTVDFGVVMTGTKRDSTFVGMMKNAGSGPCMISSITITGTGASSFAISGVSMPMMLMPGMMQSMTISFDPKANGVATAQIHFTSNAASNPIMSLVGTGASVEVSIQDSALAFTTANVGKPAELTMNVNNTGLLAFTVTPTITGSGAARFSLVSPTGEFALQAGQSKQMTIKFTPINDQVVEADLELTISGLATVKKVHLTGSVVIASVEDPATTGSFSIYPNPTDKGISAEFYMKQAGTLDISISDIYGNRVKAWNPVYYDAGQQILKWDGTDENGMSCSSGEYLMIIKSGNGFKYYPIMVIK